MFVQLDVHGLHLLLCVLYTYMYMMSFAANAPPARPCRVQYSSSNVQCHAAATTRSPKLESTISSYTRITSVIAMHGNLRLHMMRVITLQSTETFPCHAPRRYIDPDPTRVHRYYSTTGSERSTHRVHSFTPLTLCVYRISWHNAPRMENVRHLRPYPLSPSLSVFATA